MTIYSENKIHACNNSDKLTDKLTNSRKAMKRVAFAELHNQDSHPYVSVRRTCVLLFFEGYQLYLNNQ